MAALIDVDDFRGRFDIDDGVGDPRLVPHISSASKRLRQWVGDTYYDAALALIESDDDDLTLLEILQNAEAHLAFYYALLGMNYPLSAKGIVGTAMSDEGKEMRKYLSPDQTAAVAQQFLDHAELIARPYMTASEPAVPLINEEVETIYYPPDGGATPWPE